eukprot:TRINITY_DN4469_c0_g6_i1.p1 TRINITY_DN4469_c0_g6~~TRINITY_DN4469_c0_g6_i1.p1  ORF type:complete len:487 (+),score=246.31 TRINITY_DN4469_c0_g6_i1:326-1786(+)
MLIENILQEMHSSDTLAPKVNSQPIPAFKEVPVNDDLKNETEIKVVRLKMTEEGNSPRQGNAEKALSKEEKQRLEEEAARKKKEAAEFISKINAEKKERKRKEEERQKMLEKKLRKESEEFNVKLKEREDEVLKRRKEKTIITYEQIRKKREEDRRLRQERSRPSLPPKDEYLYRRLEEKYQKEVLMPMLEEKKKELAKKRNQQKPVTREEVALHMKRHDLLLARKEESRQQELREKREKEMAAQASIGRLRTGALERLVLEETKAKGERERKRVENRERREKMENYANLIKETCPVRASSLKAKQLQTQIESLKHPVREPRDIRKNYDPIKLKESSGGNFSMHRTGKEHSANKASDDANKSSSASECTSARRLKKRHMAQTTEEIKPEGGKVDYLAELRRKRESNRNHKLPKYDWTTDLNDDKLDTNEKYSRLIGKANLIEEQARKEEKLLHVKGGTEHNPEMGEHVSDMFIDAIKAKLAILENL